MDVDKGRAHFDEYDSSVKQGTGNLKSCATDSEIIPFDDEPCAGKGANYDDEAVESNIENLWPALFRFQGKTTLPGREELAQRGFAMYQ